jgi:hypothetical protein
MMMIMMMMVIHRTTCVLLIFNKSDDVSNCKHPRYHPRQKRNITPKRSVVYFGVLLLIVLFINIQVFVRMTRVPLTLYIVTDVVQGCPQYIPVSN